MLSRAQGDKHIRIAACFLLTSLLVLSLSFTAQADPAAITQAQGDLAQLRVLVNQLDNELSIADENYNQAAERLKQTQAAQAETQAKLGKTKADLASAQQRLMNRLVEIYKGGDSGMLDVLLGAEDFSELVNRIEQLGRIGEQDNELVGQVKDYLASVSGEEAQLAKQAKDEKSQTAQLAAAKAEVAAQLAKQSKALRGKEAQLAELKKEEAARQAALAAAAKKAAEEAAKAAAEAAREAEAAKAAREAANQARIAKTPPPAPPSSQGEDTSTADGGAEDSAPADSSGREAGAKVIDIAVQYVGTPYVWAGASPSGFDCSGFVMYVFNKVGVHLPHSAVMQYECGTHVPRAELQPGDLVFFYHPIHHVGIYIGNGQMVNARGDQVQIDSAFWDDYVGATRIL